MDIYKQAEEINNQKDFVKFLNSLQKDLQENLSEWENDSLAKFLDALKGYCSDKDQKKTSWKTFAELLLAARVYE